MFQYYTRWSRENSSLLYLPAFLGGTDAAGYKPHDVCKLTMHIAQLAYKLEGQKLTRMSISDQYYTRWSRENSSLLYLPAFLGGTDAWSSMYILVHWWPSSFSFEKLDMAFHQLTSLSALRCFCRAKTSQGWLCTQAAARFAHSTNLVV